ncbi:MAG: ACT domain-containing protein [Eubacteriales bacterium]|nr:ACT domain-containing protein [Eubacteriales bacterium]
MSTVQKAAVTVLGKDQVGIIAKVTAVASEVNANVTDISQSVLDGTFCMAMIIDITEANASIDEIQKKMQEAVPTMVVHVMHEKIFDSMHRI